MSERELEPDWLNTTLVFYPWPHHEITVGDLRQLETTLRAEHAAHCEHKTEVARLRDLCLRAAFYIGVRQGPEVDEEADELLRKLKGET